MAKAKALSLIVFLLIASPLAFIPFAFAQAVTVDEDLDYDRGTQLNFQRKVIQDEFGTYYAFYQNTTQIMASFNRVPANANWSSPVTIATALDFAGAGDSRHGFDVLLNGDEDGFHITWEDNIAGNNTNAAYYRSGSFNETDPSNIGLGTIRKLRSTSNFIIAGGIVDDGGGNLSYIYHTFDADGISEISTTDTFQTFSEATVCSGFTPSSVNGGAQSFTWGVAPNKTVIFKDAVNLLKFATFDGSSWSSCTDVDPTGPPAVIIPGIGGFQGVANGTRINLAYRAIISETLIRHRLFNGTDWSDSAPTIIGTNVGDDSFPAIAIDAANEVLYAFWIGNSTSDNVQFSTSSDSGATWASPTTIQSENSTGILDRSSLTAMRIPQTSLILAQWAKNSTIDIRVSDTQVGPGGAASITHNLTINNIDYGRFIIAGRRYYDFEARTEAINALRITEQRVQFSDGAHTIEVRYNNETDTFSIVNDEFAFLSTSASNATSFNTASNNFTLVVHYLIFPRPNILDRLDAPILMFSNTSSTFSQGFEQVTTVDIFNKGGFSEFICSGTCDQVDGGDIFDIFVEEGASGSWAATNITFRNLQAYGARFALRLSFNETGQAQLWQDFDHSQGGAEQRTAKGDWQLRVRMYYALNDTSTIIDGWHVLLQMEEGDVGVNDFWTGINATWFNSDGDTFNSTDVFFAFVEDTPKSTVQFWLDFWFNKQNASSIHGGRVNPVFLGMRNGGGLMGSLFPDWAPFLGNQSLTNSFEPNLDAAGNVVLAQNIEFMVLGFNLSRPSTVSPIADFRATLGDFVISEFRIAEGQMVGVQTPIYNEPKIPNLPLTGFLVPLYAVIASIGDLMVSGLTWAAIQGWQLLQSTFPWLTGTVERGYQLVDLFTLMLGEEFLFILGFLNVVVDALDILLLPLRGIQEAWILLSDTYFTLFGTVDMAQFLSAGILIIFLTVTLGALMQNDWPFLWNMFRMIGNILMAVVDWTLRLVSWVISIAVAIRQAL